MIPNRTIIRPYRSWVTFLIVAGIACVVYAFQGNAVEEKPAETIEWHSANRGGWATWGQGGNCLYGTSVKQPILDIWQWTGQTLKRRMRRDLGQRDPLSLTVLNDTLCVSCYSVFHKGGTEAKPFVCVFDLNDEKSFREWRLEQNLCYRVSRASANGAYVAFRAEPDTKSPDFGSNKVQVGLLAPGADRIDWITTMTCRTTTANIGGVVPSNDGKYIAFAGWDHGANLVSVAKKKVLWQMRPENEVCFTDIAFSPDNNLVYAGGGEGCVYGMKVQDGEIVSRWWATPTGKSEYGFRISTMSVSPDGRYVAAGTGPTGLVFLFSTKTGKLLRTLDHGGSTIMVTSFSPDLKRLATIAAGQIKIWKLPEEA